MRIFVYLLSILLLSACGTKKKTINPKLITGEIRYAISLQLNDNAGAMEDHFGKAAIASFNHDYLRFQKDQQEQYGNFQIVNLATGEEINYLTVKDKKLGVKTPSSHIPSIGNFQFLEEYKTIAGYRCQKAIAPMGDGKMTVYLTKEIGVNFCPYVQLEGFALAYSLAMPYGQVDYLATQVMLPQPEAASIAPPTDYQLVSPAALEREIVGDKAPAGQRAKAFQATDLDGNAISLANLKGKVAVLNFWFTQCPPCKYEIPSLNQLKANYAEQDVAFLAISFDSAEEINKFLKNTPFDFKIIPNAREIIKDYDIFVYPTTLILDPEGYLLDTKMGGSAKIMEELKKVIDQALARQ